MAFRDLQYWGNMHHAHACKSYLVSFGSESVILKLKMATITQNKAASNTDDALVQLLAGSLLVSDSIRLLSVTK